MTGNRQMSDSNKIGYPSRAVFDIENQELIRRACDNDTERVLIYLMMDLGLHPDNVRKLTRNNLLEGIEGMSMQYRRSKNAQPMSSLIPKEIAEALRAFVKKRKKRSATRNYNRIVHKVGARVGIPEISPRWLRKTCCINELRKFRDQPDRMDLVATRMGCRRETVARYYLELDQWERI